MIPITRWEDLTDNATAVEALREVLKEFKEKERQKRKIGIRIENIFLD